MAAQCHAQHSDPSPETTSAVRASPRVLVATYGVSATAATALKLSVRKVAHDITAPRRVGTRSRVISWIDG